jgi:hypothetical protein
LGYLALQWLSAVANPANPTEIAVDQDFLLALTVVVGGRWSSPDGL